MYDRASRRDRVIVVNYSIVICPVIAVSLSSRCELLLGGPSIHARCSQLPFRGKDSNPHSEIQNLAS